MPNWKRRSVLATGVALSTGALASVSATAADVENTNGLETGGSVDRPSDTRITRDQTGESGVRIEAVEDMAGLELTISENTTGVDTAEIADALGRTLTEKDISGLSSGDTFRIEHDLKAGEEYIVLIHADDTYHRGAYNESPEWPYDGGEFRVVEGIWGRDNSSTGNFYAYTKLTALLDTGDNDNNDDGDSTGTVDRPADTRISPNVTAPSGVRIETAEDMTGLELTISEETAGADTAEIADELGRTLTEKDISGLGPGDSFEIRHDLEAGEEYIILIDADDSYDRGAYNENPDWPYDGGQFQVVEGIWGRDNSSTGNFYAYTKLTALLDTGDNDNNDDGDSTGTVNRPADTRISPNVTGSSGVRIEVSENLSGLELTISEETAGADTAEIADELGRTLTEKDISGLGPGDSFEIRHDLEAGEEYIILIGADDSYDRGAYNESPDWPYDGNQFQVVEGIWGRDNSSTGNFYAYTKLTALLDGDGSDGNDGDSGSVDRPADTRISPNVTAPSGVRIEVSENLSGLELTISEETTGADTAEIADELGRTLTEKDISGLGSGDSFQIEYDLEAGEEYIVLIHADDTYVRGAYNEEPDWPYDGDQFQVVEGIWGRDNSSTGNFYAYTKLTALR